MKEKVICGRKSNSQREDKRDREKRKVRAGGRGKYRDERGRFTLAGLKVS